MTAEDEESWVLIQASWSPNRVRAQVGQVTDLIELYLPNGTTKVVDPEQIRRWRPIAAQWAVDDCVLLDTPEGLVRAVVRSVLDPTSIEIETADGQVFEVPERALFSAASQPSRIKRLGGRVPSDPLAALVNEESYIEGQR